MIRVLIAAVLFAVSSPAMADVPAPLKPSFPIIPDKPFMEWFEA